MTPGATVYVAMATTVVMVVAMVVTRLHVATALHRRMLYVLMGAATAILMSMIVLWWQPTVDPPPIGFVVLMAVAIGASILILWIAGANGWLRSWPGRAGAGAAVYVVLLVAYPPIFGAGWQVAALFLGLALAGVVAIVGGWQMGGQAAVYAAQVDFDEEDEDDEWTLEEVGGAGAAVVAGTASVIVHEPLREGSGGGAGEDGAGALRLSGGPGASPGNGGAGAGAGGRTDGDGAGERTSSNGARAGGDGTADGMVVYPAVVAADRHSRRRGRGVRLAGALVPRSVAPGPGADAGGDYDVANATAMASLASTGGGSGE